MKLTAQEIDKMVDDMYVQWLENELYRTQVKLAESELRREYANQIIRNLQTYGNGRN